jgi:nucleoid DNA-binding protein
VFLNEGSRNSPVRLSPRPPPPGWPRRFGVDREQPARVSADTHDHGAAVEDVVLEEIGNAQKVQVGGLAQLTVRVKPATKARMGRNPAAGEEINSPGQAASVDLRVRPLAKARGRCRWCRWRGGLAA